MIYDNAQMFALFCFDFGLVPITVIHEIKSYITAMEGTTRPLMGLYH